MRVVGRLCLRAAAPTVVVALLTAASCAKTNDDLVARPGAADAIGFDPGEAGVSPEDGAPIDLEAGPEYAVFGVQPSHGPFKGGTRIEIRGRGFSSHSAVRIGTGDVAAVDVVPSDPYHVQAVTPPGDVGPADVQLSDTLNTNRAVLASGFTYDSYYADPNTGATAGGTHVALVGQRTKWGAGTAVTIDGKPCTEVAIDDATHLHCLAPKGTPGTKAITVTTADLVVDTVRDAYTYADTSDGYRGGLAGATLPGELDVLALANPDGSLVPSATVIVRGADGSVQTGSTNEAGVAAFPAPPAAPLTVTVTKKCLQPTTFDGVRVRSVTVYLSPVNSVACIPPDGVPPPTGGHTRDVGLVKGELVWTGKEEFRRNPWKGVPGVTKPTQRVAAYVFAAGRDNLAHFQLPDPAQATLQESTGTVGYAFQLVALPGNATLYAIAGIEDRPATGPATFDPYVFGIVRGVGVPVGGTIERVLIPMNGAFTHSVKVQITGAPMTTRGPDRALSTLAVDLGGGYMVLPYGYREDLLPLGGPVDFVGMPPLSGALGSSSYVLAVEDVTGGPGGAPLSSILRYKARDDSKPVVPARFIEVPKFLSPTPATAWDGRTVTIDLPTKSADLLIIAVGAGDGSTGWTIVAPGETRTVHLPDFSAKPELGLPSGNLQIGAVAATLDGFVYDTVRYGQLGRGQWSSYSYDTSFGSW